MQIICNGESRDVPEGATVAELLRELDLAHRPLAVEVNQELTPRAEHNGCKLKAGDRVEIVTLVGGG